MHNINTNPPKTCSSKKTGQIANARNQETIYIVE